MVVTTFTFPCCLIFRTFTMHLWTVMTFLSKDLKLDYYMHRSRYKTHTEGVKGVRSILQVFQRQVKGAD